MNLFEKMHNIMCETKALEKNMQVGNYKAISEASVLNEIKPLLKKYKLIIFPISVEVKDIENTYNDKYGEKTRLMTQVNVQYKIVDVESSEFEILASVGNGVDPQDKASGKAWTYAYKGLLQKTFMMFSGEDTDNTHSDDITKEMTKEPEKKITTKQAKVLNDLCKSLNKDIGVVLGYYHVNSFDEMTETQKVDLLKKLKKEEK